MSAVALLADLRSRGVALSVVDGKLHYRGPRGALTSGDRAELADHKAVILEILNDQNDQTTKSPTARPGRPCIVCRGGDYWRREAGGVGDWVCATCHPGPAPWRWLTVPEQLPDAGPCPDCRGPLWATTLVLPHGRIWHCRDWRSCGRVVYAADPREATP